MLEQCDRQAGRYIGNRYVCVMKWASVVNATRNMAGRKTGNSVQEWLLADGRINMVNRNASEPCEENYRLDAKHRCCEFLQGVYCSKKK